MAFNFQPTPVDLRPMLGRWLAGAASFRCSAWTEEGSTVLSTNVESKSMWPIQVVDWTVPIIRCAVQMQ